MTVWIFIPHHKFESLCLYLYTVAYQPIMIYGQNYNKNQNIILLLSTFYHQMVKKNTNVGKKVL